MRTRSSCLAGVLLASLVITPLARAADHAECPDFAEERGGHCVLERDVDLRDLGTVRLAPGTQLDCRGHRVYTSQPGTGIDLLQRSKPEVGLFLHHVRGVTIRDCVIEGFDFPVFALDSRRAIGGRPGNRLLHNHIVGRFVAVTLLAVDDTHVTGNVIHFGAANGLGIHVLRNSDRNQIMHNVISSGPLASDIVKFPGPVSSTANPRSSGGTGGMLITYAIPGQTLIHVVVDGELHQSVAVNDPEPNPSFPEDTLVESNTVTTTAGHNGINASAVLRPVLRWNDVSRARLGILLGAATYLSAERFPGSCSLDATRRCVADDDCSVAGIDAAGKGSCVGVAPVTVRWVTEDPVVEGNVVHGELRDGLQSEVKDGIIRGNVFSGPSWPGTNFVTVGATGLDLRGFAVMTGEVSGNTVTGFPGALRLFAATRTPTSSFGARVWGNDFVAPYPVFTPLAAPPPTEPSAGLQGNHWGLSCEESDGFDEERVLRLSVGLVGPSGEWSVAGTPVQGITDSHAYGAPVVGLDPASLPPRCLP